MKSWSVERGLGHEFANSIGTHEEMQEGTVDGVNPLET